MTLILPIRRWYCPNCTATGVTREAKSPIRYHDCPGLHGLSAPMVLEGTKVKVTAHEREDYIGSEQAGRFMSVVTERADGSNDVAVFAPSARIEVN